MADPPHNPVSQLAEALRELHEAAGAPPPSELVTQGKAQVPPVALPSSTVSDWLLGKSTPSDERAFHFLVGYLQGKARRNGNAYVPLTPARWDLLLGLAQSHRRSNQGGRPRRQRGENADTRLPRSGTAPRLTYLEQVKRIAPPNLVGRDAELAELARFSLDPDRTPYAWWQADAWAGKSALMSTFVLRPPSELAVGRVQIVSFFITARLAAQDTQEAFVQVLLEQLASLTRQPLPPALAGSTRDAFLLGLLTDAAASCAQDGGRLILVVDGLDEDRSLTTAQGAHSIAGLLPPDPPHGMRVIVAGRPNPPIPSDVPHWHPLRDPGIIRELTPSQYAIGVKDLSRTELQRLLRGSVAGQDVLGLLTAARGGLSAADLEELAGIRLWEAEEILHGAAGRTFTRRAAQWTQDNGRETYLLGHEELQAAAEAYVGEARLVAYRGHLHAWADSWRTRGWPTDTPEYLLTGYFQLLKGLDDVPRMTECALDLIRHDRMLDVTGGDVAALAEARTTLDHIAAQQGPVLGAAVALACHRDQLTSRNASVPVRLPAVWTTLGHLPRAQALAASITHPGAQAGALVGIAEALANAGQLDQATVIATQAQDAGRLFIDFQVPAPILARIAVVLAAAGQYDRATGITDSITDFRTQMDGRARIAGVLAAAGQYDRATAIAASVTAPKARVDALARIAEALASAGQYEQASAIAGSVKGLRDRVDVLARIAGALAHAGQHDQAVAVATQAEDATESITDPPMRAPILARIAGALAAAGQYDRATETATRAGNATRAIPGAWTKADALAHIAEALAAAGQYDRATETATRAENAVRSISDPRTQAGAQARIAETLATAGQHDRATAIAASISAPEARADALTRVAGALAAAGQYDRATETATRAENAARSMISPWMRADALARVAEALAAATRFNLAAANAARRTSSWVHSLTGIVEALADAGPDHRAAATAAFTSYEARAEILARIAKALAAAGQYDRTIATAKQADETARSITDQQARAPILARIAGALAAAGQFDQAAALATRAEKAARSIDAPWARADALARVAEALAAADQYHQAAAIAAHAEDVARSVADPRMRADALARVAEALAAAGQYDRAAAVTASIGGPWALVHALARVAEALAAADQYDRAAATAAQAESAARSIAGAWMRAQALARIAEALAAIEQCDRAAAAAAQAEDAAQLLTESDTKADTLARIAGALAAAGQYGQAAATAASITRAQALAQAVANIATAHARAGNTQAGSRMAAMACATGDWMIAVGAVLLLDPSALMSLLNVLNAPESGVATRGSTRNNNRA